MPHLLHERAEVSRAKRNVCYHSLSPSGSSAQTDSVLLLSDVAGGASADVRHEVAFGSRRHEQCANPTCKRRFRDVKGKPRWIKEGDKDLYVCQKCWNAKRPAPETPPPTVLAALPRRVLSAPIQFTPERVDHLKKEIKAAGVGQQGRTRSAPENARALLHLEQLVGLQPKQSVVRALPFASIKRSKVSQQRKSCLPSPCASWLVGLNRLAS
jgi:hypothetical protein